MTRCNTAAVNPNSPLPAPTGDPLIEEFVVALEALSNPDRARALRIAIADLQLSKRPPPLTPDEIEVLKIKSGFTAQQAARFQRAVREAFDFEHKSGKIQAQND